MAGDPRPESKGIPPGIWSTNTFSQEWLRDAYRASLQDGPDYRRHEVLFSTCFAETFLFEWTIGPVLRYDFEALGAYFPEGARRGVEEKCKDVLKRLAGDGRIKAAPDWGKRAWSDFVKVVRVRDALIHASMSRPHRLGPGEADPPSPTALDFYELEQGWALDAVRAFFDAVHTAAELKSPLWLTTPKVLLQE